MFKELKKFPVVIIFFVFLFSFSIMDELWPKRSRSELENRELAQYPRLTLKSLFDENYDKTWMSNFDKYIKDQFILRDEWIDLKSRCESVLLKLENNNVWYGKDDRMFQKLLFINEGQLNKNLQFLSNFSTKHSDKVTTMIVPSASLVWENKLPFAAPIIDEGKYLNNIFTEIGKTGANVIDLREIFKLYYNKEDFPIYYKTDHHWTTEGAYLAYSQFADLKGLAPFDKNKYPEMKTENFLGTNYSKARKYGTVSESITWYDIPNQITIYKTDGSSEGVASSMYNSEKWKSRDKYGAFLNGNNGYSIINGNPEGKNILIIKDSYANCFIPFLTANYNKIGIVDLRATMLNINEVIANENYDEVLILYNFQTFTNDTYLWKLAKS